MRWFGLVLGLLAISSLGVIAGYHWQQAGQTSLPTVKAFTPGTRGYVETTTSTRGPGGYRIIDGDTIEAPFGVKYRLLGYDTPETYFSKCDEELELGRRATERLEELMASGEVRIVETGKLDKYRRSLAHLYINGRDVGEILIGEGLARAYDGGKREPWC